MKVEIKGQISILRGPKEADYSIDRNLEWYRAPIESSLETLLRAEHPIRARFLQLLYVEQLQGREGKAFQKSKLLHVEQFSEKIHPQYRIFNCSTWNIAQLARLFFELERQSFRVKWLLRVSRAAESGRFRLAAARDRSTAIGHVFGRQLPAPKRRLGS
jgi:hypothetical protein